MPLTRLEVGVEDSTHDVPAEDNWLRSSERSRSDWPALDLRSAHNATIRLIAGPRAG